jgi:hypothetical protein
MQIGSAPSEMTRSILAFLVLSLAGCTETIRFQDDPLETLVSLEVTPADATIGIAELAPPYHTLQYSAIGHFADGTTTDLTNAVTWAIDRDLLGTVDERGLLTTSNESAGYGTIAARVRGLQATASVRIMIDATIIDATFPPPGAGLFAPPKPTVTNDPTRSPALLYPSDGTYMPQQIASTLFQLSPGSGNNAFRITFETPLMRLRVETGADRWRADGATQRLIAASAGVDAMAVTVEATAPGSPIYAAPPASLGFSDLSDAPIYFWSASTNGIMRGGVDVATSSKLYPSNGTCVGCHSISRDGERLALGVDDGNATTFQLSTISVVTQQPIIPAMPNRRTGWAAYSPDGTRIVVANDGALAEYNAQTGASLGAIALPAGRYATHPDWSPDGKSLAIAYTSLAPTNMDVRASSIAVLTYTNGTWGAPQVVVAGSATSNSYFPRWSPDGSYIAFVRATTASRGAPSADLMLVAAAGGPLTALARANHRVGATDVPDVANTMPTWGPRVGTRLWLAFTSSRPYGKVLAGGLPQIWITSLDLTQPGDPTTPAFWLPCQDVTVLNNNPIWSGQQVTTL